MTRRILACIVAGLALTGGTALLAFARGGATPQGSAPIAVELFTSQGCSSCPPADALAAKLAGEPGVVVISRPVTYWDRLGWKDTLASRANTALQRAYAQREFDSSGVYTPQIVVDGQAGTVGSRETTVRGMIQRAAQTAHPALATARVDGKLLAKVGSGKGQGELVLVALKRRTTVGIGSGENGGRKVTYTNVVRGERTLGEWDGRARQIAIPAAALKVAGADGYALLLREPGGGRIFASRLLPGPA